MESYFNIVKKSAKTSKVNLLDAFKWVDVSPSTYHRLMAGQTEMRHATAVKVARAIEELHSLHIHRASLAKLRESGK
jgi:hypothetical protein